MIWILVGVAIGMYILGFFLGRKYERDELYDSSVGVLVKFDKTSDEIDSITFYYSQEVYDDTIKQLKDSGDEYYE